MVNSFAICDYMKAPSICLENLVLEKGPLNIITKTTKLSSLHTGNFYIFQIGLKMVNFGGFLGISVGFSQTGKVLPKPRMALTKPILTPGMGFY